MSEEDFDPYSRFLKVPAEQCPPDHYALLGLTRYEEVAETIDDAVKQRTAYLHKLAAGPDRKVVQRLLGEVAIARRTLMTVEAKLAYDESLRNPPQTGNPTLVDSSPAGSSIQIAVEDDRPARKTRGGSTTGLKSKRRKNFLFPVILVGGSALLVIALGVAVFMKPANTESPLANPSDATTPIEARRRNTDVAADEVESLTIPSKFDQVELGPTQTSP